MATNSTGTAVASLQTEIRAKGWCCYNSAVEVGARGVVAQSLERAARRIGFKAGEASTR